MVKSKLDMEELEMLNTRKLLAGSSTKTYGTPARATAAIERFLNVMGEAANLDYSICVDDENYDDLRYFVIVYLGSNCKPGIAAVIASAGFYVRN